MTTLEPGARLVLTQGLALRPRAAAFLASRPAPTITDGLEVLVQLVMAEITTEPWVSSKESPFCRTGTVLGVSPPFMVGRASAKDCLTPRNGTRSWGRRGPARLGSTSLRSSSRVSVNTGSGVSSVRNSPCSLQ